MVENLKKSIRQIKTTTRTSIVVACGISAYKFADVMMDKPVSFYAFEMLYWCGLRHGEMLALTPADFDFQKETVRINKSYQRFDCRDVITDPKTPKSKRTVKMPTFLAEEMQDYIHSIYGIEDDDRIFQITKSYMHHEMETSTVTLLSNSVSE